MPLACRPLLPLLLVLLGCTGEPVVGAGPDDPMTPCERPCHCTMTRRLIWHRPVVRLDLLIVVDNSASMSGKLEVLRRELPGQLRRLLDLPEESGCSCVPAVSCDPWPSEGCIRPLDDVQVAVVTTDLGAGGWIWPTCGAERPRPDLVGVASRPYPFGGRSATDTFEEQLTELLSLPANGCMFEQPLESALQAVQGDSVAGATASGFPRPDADLAVLVVSDEDDCSVDDPSFFDPGVSPATAPDLRCRTLADRLRSVDRYADAFISLAGRRPEDFQLLLAVGTPTDGLWRDGHDLERLLDDPTMREEVDLRGDRVLQVCDGPGGSATPARRLVGLAERSHRPTVVSICSAGWPERLIRNADWPWWTQILPQRCLLSGLDVHPDPATCRYPCDAVEILSDDRSCPSDPECPCDAAGCRDPLTGATCEPLKRDDGFETDGATGSPRRRCVWRQATTRPTPQGGCSEPLDRGWYFLGPREGTDPDSPYYFEDCATVGPEPDYNHSFVPPYLEPGSDLAMECSRTTCPSGPPED